MGRRSWIVKTDEKHYNDVFRIMTEQEDLFIVGAGKLKSPLKEIDGGTHFDKDDLVLLLQSDGSYVITEYPNIFNREFCLLDNVETVREKEGYKINELDYMDEAQFKPLLKT